ncbi:MAG TPA: penicillin-binding transpeptidase domain-containing protein, partial [Candidatus Lustribacter sp.]|nr:penicillin-binding transpeptidase domain-containing protein [Candidatus Lustribacter sp.]
SYAACSPGLTVAAVGTAAGGQTVARDLIKVDPVPGTPLATTLDVATQAAADTALSAVSGTASLVAIRVSTGQILAAANAPASAVVAMATTGHAAPGSSFKVVSSLALLRAGLTPSSPIPCTRTITVDGRTFRNHSDYPPGGLGRIPLRTAVANSCNTAFISQQARVSQARLAEAGAALGLGPGDDLDLGFPAYLGSVPAEATGTEHAASLIGQGRVEASPLAMATVMASVMRGQTVRPVLLPGQARSHPAPAVPLTAAEAAALRTLLGAVVSQGSGRALAPLGVTLAKTGTAEFGSGTPPKTHGWMVAGRGDIAIAAYVENGASGAKTAGPIIAAFLTALG